MTSEVIIRIKEIQVYEVIKTLLKFNIYYDELKSEGVDVVLKVNVKDLRKIKIIFKPKKIEKIGYTGLLKIKLFFSTHYIFILSMFFSYLVLLILSNTIFFININTNNLELKKELFNELNELGIKKYKRKKSYEELTQIKEVLLRENKDKLEWLEIIDTGVTYVVEITERVIKNDEKDDTLVNIVAEKDALIKKIVTTKGTPLKYVDDYVKKGEVIITSDIIKNEEVVGSVRASGDVFGEVWYTVTTTVPYNFIEYASTGEKVNHYYINFLGSKMSLIGKYDVTEALVTEKVLIDKPYLFFKLVKEEKEIYKYTDFSLTKEEAYLEAIKRSDKSINVKLNNGEYIIDKKVLKKSEFSSKIEIEVFYRVYENIGVQGEILELKE